MLLLRALSKEEDQYKSPFSVDDGVDDDEKKGDEEKKKKGGGCMRGERKDAHSSLSGFPNVSFGEKDFFFGAE